MMQRRSRSFTRAGRISAISALAIAAAACSGKANSSPKQWSTPTVTTTEATFAALGSKTIEDAALVYPAPAEEKLEAPLSLTASDGTGLALRGLRARAVVDGPIAFTELHLRFENPQDRVLEGRFSITLPEGATISRLAMKLDSTGQWQEAEVVELAAARRAYEDFLHRRQDPALLEKEAGNQFRARIFPINARADKEIIVSYSQELVGDNSDFVLPLRGLPVVDDLAVLALVARGGNRGYEPVTLATQKQKPTTDFRVRNASRVTALRSGELFAAKVRPTIKSGARPIEKMTVLFDTSASRAPGFAGQVAKLSKLIAEVAKTADYELIVIPFDQTASIMYRGSARAYNKGHARMLLARRPLGASDLGAALAQASDGGRLVLVSDSIATAGDSDAGALRQALLDTGATRLDVILSGGIRDSELATSLARGVLSRAGTVLDGDKKAIEGLATRLRHGASEGLKVEVAGARWVYPREVTGLQAGDEVMVYAELGRGAANPTIQIGGKRVAMSAPAVATRPLLSRSMVRAKIRNLTEQRAALSPDRGDKRKKLKHDIIALSTKHRVLSDFTGLLVLETEEDYKRFDITRRGLADIMTVTPAGIKVVSRQKPVLELPDAVRPDRKKDVAKAKKKEAASGDKSSDFDFADDDVSGDMARPGSMPAPKPAPQAEPSPAAPPPPPSQTRVAETERQVSRRRPPRPDNDADGIADEEDSDDSGAADGTADEEDPEDKEPALAGRLATLMARIDRGEVDAAVADALRWRTEEPGDVMALVGLGTALERKGAIVLAARAYGSIVDLFPSRADMRRFAAVRLQRLADAGAALAVDSLEKAVAQRPDHLHAHRLLAYANLRLGDYAAALAALEAGLTRNYPDGRFAEGRRVLSEDLSIIGAVWAAKVPAQAADIAERLKKFGASIATEPSLRFVLNWETDANDVDFHIYDGKKNHAFFRQKQLKSGGALYADITNGYGPECFAIKGPSRTFPYRLKAHYYSRGPMGYGTGQLEIVDHDGRGNVRLESRPFVVMNDGAYVNLGSYGPNQIAK